MTLSYEVIHVVMQFLKSEQQFQHLIIAYLEKGHLSWAPDSINLRYFLSTSLYHPQFWYIYNHTIHNP